MWPNWSSPSCCWDWARGLLSPSLSGLLSRITPESEQGVVFGTFSSVQTLARMISYSAANVLLGRVSIGGRTGAPSRSTSWPCRSPGASRFTSGGEWPGPFTRGSRAERRRPPFLRVPTLPVREIHLHSTAGPSPRGWRERPGNRSKNRWRRTIPTRVGRTVGFICEHFRSYDHPHVGGESRRLAQSRELTGSDRVVGFQPPITPQPPRHPLTPRPSHKPGVRTSARIPPGSPDMRTPGHRAYVLTAHHPRASSR